MRIAVPRERKGGETRVALTPAGVAQLVADGNEVYIEVGAGARSFYSDEEYRSAGASIVETLEELWAHAELLLKVKEPAPEEFQYFREDLLLFSFLHPAAFPEMCEKLLGAGSVSFSYDLLENTDGHLPLLRPMSIIAGTLSVYAGCNALLSNFGGRGTLLSEVCAIPAGEVLVVGAGSAGSAAAEVASRLGARTHVIDLHAAALERLKQRLPSIETIQGGTEEVRAALPSADLVVSAVLVPGDRAPKLIQSEMMKAGSAFVDISIDQGGSANTSRATSIAEPTYVENEVVHYCVPNMPALAAQTATLALTTETMPYVRELATLGLTKARKLEWTPQSGLATALVTSAHELRHPVVRKALEGN